MKGEGGRLMACYHARVSERYGQRVAVVKQARRGTHPRNVLVRFEDGTQAVTSIGCLRWKCDRHQKVLP